MTARHDRIEGFLLGTAAGDALGAPYEFQPPRGPELPVEMAGGGGWEPGEWTDDTAMAVAIAELAGDDLRDEAVQDALVARWYEWSRTAKDVGIQTRAVLSAAARGGPITAAKARAASAAHHADTGRTAGNGSLMRTAPVALAYLDDEDAMVAAARAISELTHFDPDAADACVLWCCAIRHAVLTTDLDVRIGLGHLDSSRQGLWAQRIEEAERVCPADIPNNGWVVAALQAAWSAIHGCGGHGPAHLRDGLDAAVRAGFDTDTVAAIAGGLLGAAYGASAVPLQWRALLHGWPGLTARGLVGLAHGGSPNPSYAGYSVDALVPHPFDDGLLIGGIGALRNLPDGVDAVVSLCRVADADVPVGMPHVEVRLIDGADPDENPHLDHVLRDTVATVKALRAQGRTVLLHCVEALSRTPTVAALYGAGTVGMDESLRAVLAALPHADPNPAFRDALKRLGGTS
ncbi:ADP-ribosylglycohydrolase family protein [Mycobacterium sp. C31M]